MAHENQKVAGEYWKLKLSEDGGTTLLQLICEDGTDLSFDKDEINADSKCGPDRTPGTKTASLSSEFFLIQGANVGGTEASYKKLYEWYVADTLLNFQYGPTATTLPTGELRHIGTGYVKSLKLTGKYKEKIKVSLDMILQPDTITLASGS